MPCALLSLDQEKAFDMVDHGFMFKVLSTFGLNTCFIKWIKLLYTDVSSFVTVNGFPSDPFSIQRGVRQGCPLSPLLYVLVSETLARAIDTDASFRAFHVPGGAMVKSIQYADDITCVVSDFASFRSLSRILSVFQKATGAKLNQLKSKGLRLGGWRHKHLPFEASWVDDALKINGIWFGYGDPEHRTWTEKADLVEAKLKDFSGRWLSLPGKATVVNRFVYPLLWYPGTVFDIPARILVRLERAMFDFIWSGKTELVKRRIVYSKPKEGGLGVVHLPSKLRFLLLKCVFDAVDKPTLPFAFFVRYWAGLFLRRWYPQLFTNLEPHSDEGTGAYRQMRDTLCRVSIGGDFLSVSGERSGVLYGRLLNALCGPLPVAPGRLTSFPEVWRSVNGQILDNSLRDLSWRIAHGALVTNLRRYGWRLSDGVRPRRGCRKMESASPVLAVCFCPCGLGVVPSPR